MILYGLVFVFFFVFLGSGQLHWNSHWVGTGEEETLCYSCELSEIENEVHFALYFP